MTDELIKLLETLGYEAYLQGSFTSTNDYPNHFFTIWNDDTPALSYHDNKEDGCIWYFTINFYSINPSITTDILLKAKDLLISKGWIVSGKGNDIYSDSNKHSGRSIEAKYIENYGGNNNGK